MGFGSKLGVLSNAQAVQSVKESQVHPVNNIPANPQVQYQIQPSAPPAFNPQVQYQVQPSAPPAFNPHVQYQVQQPNLLYNQQSRNIVNGQSGKYLQQVRHHLNSLVQANGWGNFYPAQRLENIALKLSIIDYDNLATKYKMGAVEITLELCKIALVDVLIYCDDSGSMAGERWNDDLRGIIYTTSELSCIFDDNGISVRFMNSNDKEDDITDPNKVNELIRRLSPSGMTPTGVELEKKIVKPYLQMISQSRNNLSSMKPLLVVTITDGESNDNPKSKTRDVILESSNSLKKLGLNGNEIRYQFCQVGTEKKAEDYLKSLDNDPYIGNLVDCTSYYEMEEMEWKEKGVTLTPALYITKMLLGGFDPSWDSKDE